MRYGAKIDGEEPVDQMLENQDVAGNDEGEIVYGTNLDEVKDVSYEGTVDELLDTYEIIKDQ